MRANIVVPPPHPPHLAVWQDGTCRVAQERDVPYRHEAHQHRQVVLKGHVLEVVVHVVGAHQELLVVQDGRQAGRAQQVRVQDTGAGQDVEGSRDKDGGGVGVGERLGDASVCVCVCVCVCVVVVVVQEC